MILSDPTDVQFNDLGKQEDVIPLGTAGVPNAPAFDDSATAETNHPWVWLSFVDQPLPDTTPPVVANVVPASGSINIDKDQPLSFTVTDNDSGVSFSTIQVYVRGEEIFNGAAGDPWFGTWAAASSFAAITGGYAFELVPGRADYFRDETVTWRIVAQDHEGNSVDVGFRFSAIRKFRFTVFNFLIESIREADRRSRN